MNERPDIFELKYEAHDLIDTLVRLGLHKNYVYGKLRANLGVPPGMEHFGSMATMTQVEAGIRELKKMKTVRLKEIRKKRLQNKPKKEEVFVKILPAVARKEIMATHNPNPHFPENVILPSVSEETSFWSDTVHSFLKRIGL